MRYILLFILFLFGNIALCQKFSCLKLDEDMSKMIEYKKKYSSNQKWALKLNEEYGVDKNGAIHLDYIITSDSTFDIIKIMETSVGWFEYMFSSAASIKRCDYSEKIILGGGKYFNIGQYNINAIYYAKTVKIHADVDIMIRFKEDRIRVETFIRHFNLISGDSMMRSENSLVSIQDAFPNNPKANNKNAFAMAYINAYANSFNMVSRFLEYLNNNYKGEDIIDTSEDW